MQQVIAANTTKNLLLWKAARDGHSETNSYWAHDAKAATAIIKAFATLQADRAAMRAANAKLRRRIQELELNNARLAKASSSSVVHNTFQQNVFNISRTHVPRSATKSDGRLMVDSRVTVQGKLGPALVQNLKNLATALEKVRQGKFAGAFSQSVDELVDLFTCPVDTRSKALDFMANAETNHITVEPACVVDDSVVALIASSPAISQLHRSKHVSTGAANGKFCVRIGRLCRGTNAQTFQRWFNRTFPEQYHQDSFSSTISPVAVKANALAVMRS